MVFFSFQSECCSWDDTDHYKSAVSCTYTDAICTVSLIMTKDKLQRSGLNIARPITNNQACKIFEVRQWADLLQVVGDEAGWKNLPPADFELRGSCPLSPLHKKDVFSQVQALCLLWRRAFVFPVFPEKKITQSIEVWNICRASPVGKGQP